MFWGNHNDYRLCGHHGSSHPTLKVGNYCPASQATFQPTSLLFVSAGKFGACIDCGGEGVKDTVAARIRGIRIFDITDIAHPKSITNVQTCTAARTHAAR